MVVATSLLADGENRFVSQLKGFQCRYRISANGISACPSTCSLAVSPLTEAHKRLQTTMATTFLPVSYARARSRICTSGLRRETLSIGSEHCSFRWLARRHKHDGPLYTMYHELVRRRNVQADPHQLLALKALERLRAELDEKTPKQLEPPPVPTQTSGSGSFSFFNGWLSSAKESVQDTLQETIQPSVKGVYLHGGVGCGKVSSLPFARHPCILLHRPHSLTMPSLLTDVPHEPIL